MKIVLIIYFILEILCIILLQNNYKGFFDKTIKKDIQLMGIKKYFDLKSTTSIFIYIILSIAVILC